MRDEVCVVEKLGLEHAVLIGGSGRWSFSGRYAWRDGHDIEFVARSNISALQNSTRVHLAAQGKGKIRGRVMLLS
jgi:hypothetical protein